MKISEGSMLERLGGSEQERARKGGTLKREKRY